jgi:PLP dependent protein
MKLNIAENYRKIQDVVRESERRYGRPEGSVQIIAVSKTQPVDAIQEALAAGVTDLGENRVQDALPKVAAVGTEPCWHFIGHLQSNKAVKVAPVFDMVHGVDSMKLARALGRHVGEAGRQLDVLVQVNTSGEATKSGCEPDQAHELMSDVAEVSGLQLRGLMTIGPLTDEAEAVRVSFRTLRRLLDTAKQQRIGGDALDILSMGMSGDFEMAIAEGATHVRIGTAIFGPRRTVNAVHQGETP